MTCSVCAAPIDNPRRTSLCGKPECFREKDARRKRAERQALAADKRQRDAELLEAVIYARALDLLTQARIQN